jgi:hypothetical protein
MPGCVEEKPVKQVELDALLAAPEGFGDDVPVDQNFHARRLPDHAWRRTKRSDGIEAVIQSVDLIEPKPVARHHTIGRGHAHRS